MQKNKVGPLLPPEYKVNSKGIRALDVRTKIIHTIEENMREGMCEFEFDDEFLHAIPKLRSF